MREPESRKHVEPKKEYDGDYQDSFRKHQGEGGGHDSLRGTRASEDTVNVVRKLLDHPRFDLSNPNRVRALMGTFGYGNPVALHRRDGMGYLLMFDVVKRLNTLNPSVAARILDGMINFSRFDNVRCQKAIEYLNKIKALPDLSRSVYEKVNAALSAAEQK